MQNLNRLLRLIVEAIFILVGALLLWVAWTGRYLFDSRRPTWLVLCAALILWGLRTGQRARLEPGGSWRAATKIGGASLALAGLLLLSLAWAPFRWVSWLVAATGCVFVLRGLAATALVMRRS